MSVKVIKNYSHLQILSSFRIIIKFAKAKLLELHLLSIKTAQSYVKYIWINFQGFIMMPFLCYYLQVHDCMIAILGSISIIIIIELWKCDIFVAYLFKILYLLGGLSGIEEYLVWAFATKGVRPKSQSWKLPKIKIISKSHIALF